MTIAKTAGEEPPSCPLCGSSRLRVRIEGAPARAGPERGWRVLECRACSFGFTHPRPTPAEIAALYPPSYGPYQRGGISGSEIFNGGTSSFDRLKNRLKGAVLRQRYGYDRLPPPEASHAMPLRPRPIHRLLVSLVYGYLRYYYPRLPHWRTGGRALDVGCGNGAHLLLLKRLGWEVAGFDLADHTVPEVREAGIRVHTGSLEAWASGKDGSFELITLWHVLEHVEEPRAVLRSIRRLLAPGGILMLEVPNRESLPAKIFRQHWIGYDLPRHLSHFTAKTVSRLLHEAGFTVIRRGTSWKQHLPASIRRVDEGSGGVRAADPRLRRLPVRLLLNAVGHLLALTGTGESIHFTARRTPAE